MKHLLPALLACALATPAGAADTELRARAALALAAAQPPAALPAGACGCPDLSCVCVPDRCNCQACPCRPGDACRVVVKPVAYRWAPSTDPDCACLMAGGVQVGCWFHSAQTYYRKVGDGGRLDVCPTAPPPARPTYAPAYNPAAFPATAPALGGRACAGGG